MTACFTRRKPWVRIPPRPLNESAALTLQTASENVGQDPSQNAAIQAAPRSTKHSFVTVAAAPTPDENETFERLLGETLQHVSFADWRLVLGWDNGRWYLQWWFLAPDLCNGGEAAHQKSRKWFLSVHMTKSELVQTALKAALTAVEHESRERFLYKGQPIFGPHFDIEELAKLCGSGAWEVRR
jgi:hypothetical protein